MCGDAESRLSPEHRKVQDSVWLISMYSWLYLHSKNDKVSEDLLDYCLTKLPFSWTAALFHSLAAALRRRKRRETSPDLVYFHEVSNIIAAAPLCSILGPSVSGSPGGSLLRCYRDEECSASACKRSPFV